MKVVVYAICLNEEQFVDRWVDSMSEADQIVVLDTGSTDQTAQKLRARGCVVYEGQVKPWRFDDARNVSLALVPADADICLCTDLDEILTPGWRAALEAAWTGPNCRPRYLYTWNWIEPGVPGITFWYEKIHGRNGYRWMRPVHEVLESKLEMEWIDVEGFRLEHHADQSKSRASYLPLLEQSVKEEPENDRNAHYLGREYLGYGRYDEAIEELTRHLQLPQATWNAERCASMRYISKAYHFKGDLEQAWVWAMHACAEHRESREPWLRLADVYRAQEDLVGMKYACQMALRIKERPRHYINESECWDGTLEEWLRAVT